ncbi:MAG: hypothetical protein SGJ03_02940 [Alphaproteobacteria bacterium]|nr:hypothetical protein [Alphaproteobacteria bacterium]
MISQKIAGKEHARMDQYFECHNTAGWNDIVGLGFSKHHLRQRGKNRNVLAYLQSVDDSSPGCHRTTATLHHRGAVSRLFPQQHQTSHRDRATSERLIAAVRTSN